MGTLCTGKRAPIYRHGDTLHWQKGPQIWAWGHFTLAKRAPYMGMGTLCTGKKAPIYGMGTLCTGKKAPKYGHGDTLHLQKVPHIWAWGHFALAKRPPNMGMAPIYGHGDTMMVGCMETYVDKECP